MEATERKDRAFTLIELMIGLAVTAVLLAMAIPAFQGLRQEQMLRGAQSEFLTALHHARQAAITRNHRVSLCPSPGGRDCLAKGTWHRGWLIFQDLDADRVPDPGEPVIARHGALERPLSLTSSRYRRVITFQPTGTAGGSNATFTVCAGPDAERAATVVLSRLGRIRLDEGDGENCPSES